MFKKQATTLAAGLEHDEHRDAARQALRGFLDRIEIPPGDGLLKVVGNVGADVVGGLRSRKGRQSVGRLCWLRGHATNIICSSGALQLDVRGIAAIHRCEPAILV